MCVRVEWLVVGGAMKMMKISSSLMRSGMTIPEIGIQSHLLYDLQKRE